MRARLFVVLAVVVPLPVLAQSYLDRLSAAQPAAGALTYSKAPDWQAATPIVKDAYGFMAFKRTFPAKSRLSQDMLIACMDKQAIRATPDTAVETLFLNCVQ